MIKKIGIFGGNFNPIHNAHLIIMEKVKEKIKLDKIIIVPVYKSPNFYKNKFSINFYERIKMINIAIKKKKKIQINLFEIYNKCISYTYFTIKNFIKLNPYAKYYLILGEDVILNLNKWFKINEIIKLVKIIGIRRKNYNVVNTFFPIIWIKDNFLSLNISSSIIRSYIKNGKSVKNMLPKNVMNYILMKGLYKNEQL